MASRAVQNESVRSLNSIQSSPESDDRNANAIIYMYLNSGEFKTSLKRASI